MLAKFENGYYLEVTVGEDDYGFHQYCYKVFDVIGYEIDSGRTEYRSMEMYYPMNEIDYILEYCDPYDVEGKYKLLQYETMDEYEKYLDELKRGNKVGKWILETQGTDHDGIRKYSSFDEAYRVMEMEYETIDDELGCCMESELTDEYAVIGDEEYYQSWSIYEKKSFDNPIEEKFYEIQMEIGRVDTGVSQYAYELEDTDVIRDHLCKVEKLINELREMM